MAEYPTATSLKAMFDELRDYTKCQIQTKIYDCNKSNVSKGHLRTILITSSHKIMYKHLFGTEDTVQVESIQSFQDLFPEVNTVRFHHYGDVTICAPQVVVTEDMLHHTRGTLAVPIQKTESTTLCFIPCGGPEAETGIVPYWVKDVSITEICKIDEERLPKRRGELLAKVKADGKENFFSCKKDCVEAGDKIAFHGEVMTAYAVSDEPFTCTANDEATVRTTTVFEYNHAKNVTFKIIRVPKLKGEIITIPNSSLRLECPITISHVGSKKDSNVGDIKVTYKNYIFNQMGFITHDAIIDIV